MVAQGAAERASLGGEEQTEFDPSFAVCCESIVAM